MAFTVGRHGIGSLLSLGKLMAGVYVTCFLFVFVVLGAIAAVTGFSIVKHLKYIGEEILIVLGTSSSETVLPRLMRKMEQLGCAKSVVGLVVPTGYSFNLDGTSIETSRAGEQGAGARTGCRGGRLPPSPFSSTDTPCAIPRASGCRGARRACTSRCSS